jgi:hypothetical protein
MKKPPKKMRLRLYLQAGSGTGQGLVLSCDSTIIAVSTRVEPHQRATIEVDKPYTHAAGKLRPTHRLALRYASWPML